MTNTYTNYQEDKLKQLSQKELIDIVLSLQKQNKVQQTPSLFKKILDHTTIGVYIADKKHKIIYANEYYTNLLDNNDNFTERNTWDFVFKQSEKNRLVQLWKEAIHRENFDFYARYAIQSNHNILWIEEKVSRIIDKEGQVWYEGIVQDISKQVASENERKIQEIRLQLALDATKQGIWDWNLAKDKIYFSAEYFGLLGYRENPAGFTNQDWIDKIHPADKQIVLKHQNECLERKRMSYDVEYRLKLQSQKYHWFRSKGRVVNRNKDGKASRVIGTLTDIHEQKINEQVIIASEEKFRNLIENNPAGVCIYTRHQFLYANPEFCKLSGYDIHELIEMKPYQLIHRGESNKIREIAKKLFDEKTAYIRSDLKIRGKKEKILWIDFHSSVTTYDNERVAIASIYDITKRKKAEEELKEANEGLRAAEEELRQNAEELSSINDNLEHTMRKLSKTLDKEREVSEKLEKKNELLNKQKKELTQTLKELKSAQNQLIQSEKMASLGILVAGLAHEINNTINYISVSSEGLKAVVEDLLRIIKEYEEVSVQNVIEKLDSIIKVKQELHYTELVKEAEELTHNIATGAEQTAEIVRGLRNFSRMDGGQIEQVDIHEGLDSTLIVLFSTYKTVAQIEKNYQYLPKIKCSPSKLNQVFMNIIGNAIDAVASRFGENPEKGKIKISTEFVKESNQVLISIQDNGIGVSKETNNKIFEPFFTTKEIGKGTGLGLAISLGIVESHGGTLSFDSVENKGTEFKIYLPTV